MEFTPGNTSSIDIHADYDYQYPNGLDLHPDSELHKELLQKIDNRMQASYNVMSERYSSWRNMDELFQGYTPLSEEEILRQAQDKRKPVSLIIPESFAIREAMLTYLIQAFHSDYIIPYEGVGPSDTLKAMLLRLEIQHQLLTTKSELSLFNQYSDSLTYGLGIVMPVWETRYSKRNTGMQSPQDLMFSDVLDSTNRMVFEGNRLYPISVYNYFPDPSVAVQNIQDGEFIGVFVKDNRLSLLREEQEERGSVFNARYLSEGSFRSRYVTHEISRSNTDSSTDTYDDSVTNTLDRLYFYIDLVPKDWGLGDNEYPEKWLFSVVGDNLIVQAEPLNFDHGMYPITVMSPDYDGFSVAPKSRMEIINPIQVFYSWLASTHIANVVKSLNDMWVVDPWAINMNDLMNPAPNKIIRTASNIWGKGIRDSIMKFPVDNATQAHINLMPVVSNMMRHLSGATDSVQGIFDNAPERRTAEEYRNTRNSAFARLSKMARTMYIMGMRDLGVMLASHTKQFMKQNKWLRVNEDLVRMLEDEYSAATRIQNNRVELRREDLDLVYDIAPLDGTPPASDNVESYLELFQIVAQDPELRQLFDIRKMFQSVARRMGEKNVNDYVKVQPQIAPDAQVMQQVQAGNLRPMGGI